MLFFKHRDAIHLPLRNAITEQHRKLKSIQGKTKRLHRCRGELVVQPLEETLREIVPREVKETLKEILFLLVKKTKVQTLQAKQFRASCTAKSSFRALEDKSLNI